jgi:acetyl-CoA carboxylase, biotin carboxylase subunit
LPETIRIMGNKATARIAARAAAVPTAPGSEQEIPDETQALAPARDFGFPVMLKASAGGGGRGFGNGAIYLKRFLNRARHLEVQVAGDGDNLVHCFERECSLQRRRQKVWEEAPSPAPEDTTRQALCSSAVRLAKRARCRGAGTLEYLYDDTSCEFFFIEMNARIQVEHPVTGMIMGSILYVPPAIAQRQPLEFSQAKVTIRRRD